MVNYYAGSPAALPVLERQISGYPPASGSRNILTWTSPYRLFLVASSLSPHMARFIARPVGRPRFCLRGSLGLAVGLPIKWPVALPSSAAGPSCWRSSYYSSSHRRSSHRGSGLSESDSHESSYCRLTHRWSTIIGRAVGGAMSRKGKIALEKGRMTDWLV